MKKTVANFSIDYLQIMDERGKVDESLMPSISKEKLKRMYELMVLTRVFDEKAVKLQRQGRLGTYASVKGQEACQVPSAIQLEEGDIAFPAFREHAAFITRGMPLVNLLQYWGGDERGMDIPSNVGMLPVAITVGAHSLHATGMAMGFKFQNKQSVSMAYFGDGATSEGDFHEALNFAGVFKAPVIFMCQNNQYAISVPVKEQTASQTLAQKAIAYGIYSIQVDGNDVFAVYSAVSEAIKRARSGKGASFIECVTYRLSDHTTSDDASKYRSQDEVKGWEPKDPILRFKAYLINKGIIDEANEKEIWFNADRTVTEAVTRYEAIKPMRPEEIFNFIYNKLSLDLIEQQKSVG